MLIKIMGGAPVEYSLSQLRADWPDTSFPAAPSAGQLEAFGVMSAVDTPAPEIDPLTQALEGYTFAQSGDAWAQAWIVRDLSPAEAEARLSALRSGMTCTQRQARMALLGAGLLSDVPAVIEAIPIEQRAVAQIEWEYASEIRRDSAFVAAAGAALGVSDTELDALFVYAMTL